MDMRLRPKNLFCFTDRNFGRLGIVHECKFLTMEDSWQAIVGSWDRLSEYQDSSPFCRSYKTRRSWCKSNKVASIQGIFDNCVKNLLLTHVCPWTLNVVEPLWSWVSVSTRNYLQVSIISCISIYLKFEKTRIILFSCIHEFNHYSNIVDFHGIQ